LNFDRYATTVELLADRGPGNTFTTEDNTPSRIELVTDGVPGLFSRAMRFTYDNANPNAVVTVGRNVRLPHPVRELWLEVYLKWSSNFDTRGGTPPFDHKVLFGRYQPEVGRFEFKVGAESGRAVKVGSPGHEGVLVPGLTSGAFWDGQWKRIRLHWSVGTGNADGIVELWLGETRYYRNSRITVAGGASGRIYGLALGRNQDNRSVRALPMTLTWGRMRVWNTEPGW
jgi:hypothetical protein